VKWEKGKAEGREGVGLVQTQRGSLYCRARGRRAVCMDPYVTKGLAGTDLVETGAATLKRRGLADQRSGRG
jgi:hypothetical protein